MGAAKIFELQRAIGYSFILNFDTTGLLLFFFFCIQSPQKQQCFY